MDEIIVRMRNLSKVIKKNVIIDNITLDLMNGRMYGLFGRNGSGKSMLLKIISGLVAPTTGQIEVFGHELFKEGVTAKDTGILIEYPGIMPQYSGFENLKLLSNIKRIATDEDIYDALRLVGLDPNDKKHTRKYSLGMRQKLAIAQAIFEKPRLLLLDEPTNNLDSQSADEFYQLIHKLNRERKVTILIVSHQRSELEEFCENIIEIKNGAISYGRGE